MVEATQTNHPQRFHAGACTSCERDSDLWEQFSQGFSGSGAPTHTGTASLVFGALVKFDATTSGDC